MTDPAAIDGSYADFKLVKTRSVCQLVVEIPIERAEEAIRKFGIPQPGQEIPVALARLQTPPKAAANAERSEKGKERYRESDKMQQAATRAVMLCEDRKFQMWASTQICEPWLGPPIPDTAHWLRWRLNIKSRSEIASRDEAYKRFIALEMAYKQDTGQMAEARG